MPTRSSRVPPHRMHRIVAGVAVVTATLVATPAQAAPVGFELPAPSGRYSVGTTELHLIDGARQDPWAADGQRELMVSVFYPAQRSGSHPRASWMPAAAAAHFDASIAPVLGVGVGTVDWASVKTSSRVLAPPASRPGGYPVVLYSPGQGVPRTLGTSLVEDLASHGYVVVSVDHTHDASEVEFPGGRLELDLIPELTPAVIKKLVDVRVSDTKFVIEQLQSLRRGANPDAERRELPRDLGRALNLSRVGMFGHSAGGFAAAQTMYEDATIDAGINLDGTLDYDLAGKDLSPVARHGLDRPFLLMGAGSVTHHTMPSWASFWRQSTGWRLDLNVSRGGHFTFTDYQAFLPQLDRAVGLPDEVLRQTIGDVCPERVVSSERAHVAAFFDQHLRGLPQPLLRHQSPRHPDVTFVRG